MISCQDTGVVADTTLGGLRERKEGRKQGKEKQPCGELSLK